MKKEEKETTLVNNDGVNPDGTINVWVNISHKWVPGVAQKVLPDNLVEVIVRGESKILRPSMLKRRKV